MRILAIDPGPKKSAFLAFETLHVYPITAMGIIDNDDLCDWIDTGPDTLYQCEHMAIEMVACYGMPVGAEVFETCVAIGRFIEVFGGTKEHYSYLYRREVKSHLCRNSRAKDSNIRQAILDRFGGKEEAIGKKKTPGPLYGVVKDLWSALAVAITYLEQHDIDPQYKHIKSYAAIKEWAAKL